LPFNNWQITHTRPARYATCNCCEPLNKQIKETWTGYKKMHILDCFKKVIEEICLYYSIHGVPFAFYPSSMNFDKDILAKSEKLSADQFYKEYVNGELMLNYLRFWKTNKNGVYYSRLIQIVPYYCNCPTFRDVAYCHHILAIIKFKLANIIIDPMYVEPEKPKKLQTKKVRRGRPSKTKALDK